jgi:hypothetical protein
MSEQAELIEKLSAIEAGNVIETHVCRHWLRNASARLTELEKEIERLIAQRSELQSALDDATGGFCMGWPDVPV